MNFLKDLFKIRITDEALYVALQVVSLALDVHTSEKAGDILVFLTGQIQSSLDV